MADDPVLVTIELRFRSQGDPTPLADRVREAVALIVGRAELEEFRTRVMPLTPPKRAGQVPGADGLFSDIPDFPDDGPQE